MKFFKALGQQAFFHLCMLIAIPLALLQTGFLPAYFVDQALLLTVVILWILNALGLYWIGAKLLELFRK